MTLLYSLVIPVKDEEENLEDLIREIEPVMESTGESWELICVDDGSTDRSLEILTGLSREKPFLRTLVFSKNFGQSSAFDAGFKEAKGRFVITLDGDRQNDPADIPKLLQLTDDYDLICGRRHQRQDSWLKRCISRCANAIRSRLCDDGVQDTGCSLKVYRKSCLDTIKLYHGMHRFLPALFKMEGFRLVEVPVNHRHRTHGSSKYGLFNRSIGPIVDLFAIVWMKRRRLRYSIEKEIP